MAKKDFKSVMRYTVKPRASCPVCGYVNDKTHIDYCKHLLDAKRVSNSLKPYVWRFRVR